VGLEDRARLTPGFGLVIIAEVTVRNAISAMFLTAAIAAAQQASPEPTFRAGTELVQISVVAQDKQGKPVADLRRENFQIFDNGAPRDVRLFVKEPTPRGC
jgi:hypothetical protein